MDENFLNVAAKKDSTTGNPHRGPHFSDGLLLESLRGACDLLAAGYDKKLSYMIERIASVVRAANLICHDIGYPPKLNIVPGHSLPEEAFVKLYHLFKDNRGLDDYAKRMKVTPDAYLEMADFWYKARGNYEGRPGNPKFSHEYNQDNITFEDAREAVGHSVRASLCYTGAVDVSLAYGDDRYTKALDSIWRNIVYRKMHISGGIGTRHDIEGFDADYNLPNNAYLETCATIGLAFFAGEMNLLGARSEYFDVFERALYNNIIDGVGEDFRHFFYQNPLVSEGGISRWEWHGCPCCPPMLLKIFSSLGMYIYSYSEDTLCVNMYIGSSLRLDGIRAALEDKTLTVKSAKPISVKLRIPEYAENFSASADGKPIGFRTESGYAVIDGIRDSVITVSFDEKLRRVFANPKVKDDLGKIAVMNGKYLMCAEGIDNSGDTDFIVAEAPELTRDGENVVGKRADGGEFRLISYYK